MRLEEENVEQTEELIVNGASIVFYTVKVLDQLLDDIDIIKTLEAKNYKRVQHSQNGYVESIFSSTSTDNLLFKIHQRDTINKVRIDNYYVDPILNHYVVFFKKRVILLQTVVTFDYNGIAKSTDKHTKVNKPLSTTDLLSLIQTIKNADTNAGKLFYKSIVEKFSRIYDDIGIVSDVHSFDFNFKEQNIAIQIWDIASLPENIDRKNLKGEVLVSRYTLDLAALLLLYNEHHTKDGEWTKLSEAQVDGVIKTKTAAVKDHGVLISERICVEISQIDEPKFEDVSKVRLFLYGYDSTSVFLWGYLAIIENGLKKSLNFLNDLYQDVSDDDSINIKDLSMKRHGILCCTYDYQTIGDLCIEERHKEFINRGISKKRISEVLDRINKIDKQLQDLSDLSVSITTSKSSKEISDLLKAFRLYTEEQDRSNDIVSALGLILAFTSVFSVAEYIAGVFEITHIGTNFIILGSLLAVFIIIAIVLKIVKAQKRPKTEKRKNNNETKRKHRRKKGRRAY